MRYLGWGSKVARQSSLVKARDMAEASPIAHHNPSSRSVLAFFAGGGAFTKRIPVANVVVMRRTCVVFRMCTLARACALLSPHRAMPRCAQYHDEPVSMTYIVSGSSSSQRVSTQCAHGM